MLVNSFIAQVPEAIVRLEGRGSQHSGSGEAESMVPDAKMEQGFEISPA
jgi:hypothetical protein